MAAKKTSGKAKKASSKKEASAKAIADHPFETDSQIENRYGAGRAKSGSDGSQQDERGTNH